MLELAHLLADFQHQRPALALLDIEPRVVGMLGFYGVDQEFFFFDELSDQLLDGSDERLLILILEPLLPACGQGSVRGLERFDRETNSVPGWSRQSL